MDRAPRARERARARHRRGRPRARDHRDHGPGRQVGRAGAPLRERQGLAAAAPHQPVRHRAADVPRVRRRPARRRRREARGGARADPAAGARRQGAEARHAQVDRRLGAEDRLQGGLPGDRPDRRRRRPRPPADHALLAARPRAVHHAAGGHHARPRDRRPERRHVPHAEGRPALDVHALADPQGRPRRPARGARRAHPGRRRARARPRHGVLGERAAPEARRRADGRRLPQGLGRAARAVQDRRPRGARERGDRPRGLGRRERHRDGGPVRRPHRLLHAARGVPALPHLGDHDAPRRDLPLDRRRQAAGRGRVAREGDGADLPARRSA